MPSRPRDSDPGESSLLASLADFRYELRRFLQFSETAAQGVGLQPQQHQLLLQIAGAPADVAATIAYAADRLGLRHHSVVELVDRSEHQHLLGRVADPTDRRRVLLRLTLQGKRLLARLASAHAEELGQQAPRLIAALKRVGVRRGSGPSVTAHAPKRGRKALA